MFLQGLVILCAILIMVSFYYRINYSGRLIYKIPGPKGIPVFGNMLDIFGSTEELFLFARKLHQEYGDINSLKGMWYRAVNIYSPEDFEVILTSTRFSQKNYPYKFLEPWLGQGLLTSNGRKWHHRRKLLTPAFHFNILKKFMKTFENQTRETIASIQKETGKDKTEIMPLILTHTLKIMCETAMGTTMSEDIKALSNKYFTALHRIGRCITQRVARSWLYIDFGFNLSRLSQIQKNVIEDLHEFTKQLIQERIEYRQCNDIEDTENIDEIYGKKNKSAMLDLLLDLEHQGRIDEDSVREEVDTFLFEGHDTTTMALTFMIIRIANEPEAQKKIHEELDRIFANSEREPTMEELAELKYLECCIKESLRLYPSVPFIARYITEDVILSGYKVPSGTICNLHIFDVHRRADIYPDPEKFLPERFLPENSTKRHPYAYVPFSAGPRNCIGQKFAVLEIKTLMSGLLRRYRLESVTKTEDCRFVSDLVLRVKNPMYVRFRNRKKHD